MLCSEQVYQGQTNENNASDVQNSVDDFDCTVITSNFRGTNISSFDF